jgi:hypothetical protein
MGILGSLVGQIYDYSPKSLLCSNSFAAASRYECSGGQQSGLPVNNDACHAFSIFNHAGKNRTRGGRVTDVSLKTDGKNATRCGCVAYISTYPE